MRVRLPGHPPDHPGLLSGDGAQDRAACPALVPQREEVGPLQVHPELRAPLPEVGAALVEEPDLHAALEEVVQLDAEVLLELPHLVVAVEVGDVVVRPPVLDADASVVVGEGDPAELDVEVLEDVLRPLLQGLEAPGVQVLADVVLVAEELEAGPSLKRESRSEVALLTFLALPQGSSGGLRL